MTQPVSNIVNTLGTGNASTNAFITYFSERNPTEYDYNWPVQKRWMNTLNDQEWILVGFVTASGITLANWEKIGSGTSTTETLTGNSGGAVGPDGSYNINTVGDGTSINMIGNPATHTLTSNVILPAQHDILVSNTSSISGVTPSAAIGIPLVSTGTSSNPLFGTATVPGGGTGNDAFTAYSVIAAGTTSTGAFQSVGTGTTGQLLTSAGAAALPTWVTPIPSGFNTINVQTFPASGIYTPTTGMKYCIVECVGGGGAGGGSGGGGGGSAGAGGAGANYVRGFYSATTIGATETVTIGAGGTGVSSAAGNNGGPTTFGALITATGGSGGTYAAGTGSFLYVNAVTPLPGSSGGNVIAIAGCGQPAFSVATSIYVSGAGGYSYFGGGANNTALPLGAAAGNNGYSSTSYGGGGGGAVSVNNAGVPPSQTGGNGGSGFCMVTEFIN